MVKVLTTVPDAVLMEPKSVWSVSEGDGSPLAILMLFPWRLISGIKVVKFPINSTKL